MNRALFLTNVGNRDLGYREVPLFDRNMEESEKLREKCNKEYNKVMKKNLNFENFFESTKELYLSGVYKKLDLEPILIKDKVMYLCDSYDELDIKLLATMQDPPHYQDTYYSAKIIKEWLIKNYPKLENRVEVIKINENPSNHTVMLKKYNKIFSKLGDNYNDVYLGITGGTPAQISGLIINGILKWETKIKTLYKPQGKEPQENEIGMELFKEFKKEEYKSYKKSKMYLLASEVGKKYKLIEDWEYHKLRALHFKNLFDFERAINEFNEAFNKARIEHKKEIKKEIKLLEELEGNKPINKENNEPINELKENIEKYKLLINLLIDNMKSKWENGEYVDFVGRLFRLEEAVLRTIVEKEFNKSMDKKKINGDSRFYEYEELLKENSDVRNYLIEKGVEIDKGVNRHSLFHLLGYLVEKKGLKKYKRIHEIMSKLNKNNKTKKAPKKLEKVESLADLRNKSIIAHGFIGVSKENIIELYNEDKSNEEEIIENIDLVKKLINKYI
ncbi:hypothetical protein KKP97_05445 [Methanothermococcus sp. SCGC AD-155-C09]|nr:hypothetical protein [Methanothermococcus sp. SCGC AD-155-C09]